MMSKEDSLSKEERTEVRKEIKLAAKKKAIARAAEIRDEYKKQVSTAIITAFGLVIALVWKDVVTALMPSITTPGILQRIPLLSQMYTASIVTIFAVIGILIISRWSKPKEVEISKIST